MKKITKDRKTFFVDETKSSLEREFWRSIEEKRWENENLYTNRNEQR